MQESDDDNAILDLLYSDHPLYTKRVEGKPVLNRNIDTELQGLKDLALQMGGEVEKAFDSACQTILSHNPRAFDEVQKHEDRINDLQILIDEACVGVLAKLAPVAKDLRLVIAITKINTDLERMGDQSINIALSTREIFAQWKVRLSGRTDRLQIQRNSDHSQFSHSRISERF